MASIYLGGDLPVSEHDPTKVTVYNTYLQTVIESCLRKVLNKNLGGATTAQTLTVGTGTSEGWGIAFVFTVAGAAIDIKFPLAKSAGFFYVKNSSGFTLTIKTDAGGSTGVAIANGASQLLWINGNNVEAAGPAIVAGTAGAPAFIGARAYNSANISINNLTHTDLTFNSERFDTNTIHSTSTNTDRLTLPFAGKWIIGAHVSFAAHATGFRVLRIRKNATTEIARVQSTSIAVAAIDTVLTISTMDTFAANDYVTAGVYQDSGGALNVLVLTQYSPEFWCTYVGA